MLMELHFGPSVHPTGLACHAGHEAVHSCVLPAPLWQYPHHNQHTEHAALHASVCDDRTRFNATRQRYSRVPLWLDSYDAREHQTEYDGCGQCVLAMPNQV